MSRNAAVPVVRANIPAVDKFAAIVKQNIDWMTGQHANAPELVLLTDSATLADVIAMQNRIIRRLQGT